MVLLFSPFLFADERFFSGESSLATQKAYHFFFFANLELWIYGNDATVMSMSE
jgi:hypothetical protein